MAALHLFEAFVDILKWNTLGDDRVEIEQAAHVEIDQARQVHREMVHSHDRALQLLAREQVHRAEADLAVQGHHAEDRGRAAAAQDFHREIGAGLPSDGLDRVVYAAAGNLHDLLHRVIGHGVDRVGRAEHFCELAFLGQGVDGDDLARAGDLGGVDRGQADTAATDHGHGFAGLDQQFHDRAGDRRGDVAGVAVGRGFGLVQRLDRDVVRHALDGDAESHAVSPGVGGGVFCTSETTNTRCPNATATAATITASV